MSTATINTDYTANHLSYHTLYATARNAVSANTQSTGGGGVGQYYSAGKYGVYREFICFDLSDISAESEILSATFRFCGTYNGSITDFDITLVSGEYNQPVTVADFDKLNSTSFGILNTSTFTAAGWNTITLNAAGLAYLNETARDKIYLGLISSRDIAGIMPTGLEWVAFYGHYEDSYKPQLVLTVSDWPNYKYSQIPVFPSQGHVDLATYSMIKNYITDFTAILNHAVTAEGDLGFDLDHYIQIGSSKITNILDSGVSWAVFSTYKTTSPLTVTGDLEGEWLKVTASCSAVDFDVTGNLRINKDATYAGIQAKISDVITYLSKFNYVVGTLNADDAMILMDSVGDFVIKRKSAAGAIVTDIIVDYSAI